MGIHQNLGYEEKIFFQINIEYQVLKVFSTEIKLDTKKALKHKKSFQISTFHTI